MKNLDEKVFLDVLPCFCFFLPGFSNFLHMTTFHQFTFYLAFFGRVDNGQYGHHTLLSARQKCFFALTKQARRDCIAYLIIHKNFASLSAFWNINADRRDRIELWYTELVFCVDPALRFYGT